MSTLKPHRTKISKSKGVKKQDSNLRKARTGRSDGVDEEYYQEDRNEDGDERVGDEFEAPTREIERAKKPSGTDRNIEEGVKKKAAPAKTLKKRPGSAKPQ